MRGCAPTGQPGSCGALLHRRSTYLAAFTLVHCDTDKQRRSCGAPEGLWYEELPACKRRVKIAHFRRPKLHTRPRSRPSAAGPCERAAARRPPFKLASPRSWAQARCTDGSRVCSFDTTWSKAFRGDRSVPTTLPSAPGLALPAYAGRPSKASDPACGTLGGSASQLWNLRSRPGSAWSS